MAVNESLHSAFARVVCLFFLISVSAKALDPRLALEQFVHSNWVGAEIADNAGVSSLAQTKDGYLWVGTPRGLFRFDGWRFTSWGEIQDRPLREDRIRMLATDEDGDLWVGTAASLGQISPGEPIQYTERRGLPPGFLMALLPDPREGVWAATAGKASSGVARFLDRSMVALPAEKNGPESGGLSLAAGRDGNVWVGTRNGLRLIGPDGRELSFRSLGLEAFALALEPNGDVIVGGGASLFSIGGQGRGAAQRIAAFPHLAPQVARSDRDGNIWIGTLGGGLFRLGPGGVEQMRRRDGLSGDFVSAIFEDRKGNVWVGTDRGLDRFSNPTITRLPRVRGLDTSSLMVVEASRDGSVWLGAMRRGLIRMRNGSVTTYNLPGAVNSLHEDASGAMWVGTSRGLARWRDGRFTEIRGPGGQTLHQVFQITNDSAGNIWLADGELGLLRASGNNSAEVVTGLAKGVYEVYASRDGTLWAGFVDGGVAAIRGGVATSWPAVGKGTVQSIAEDEEGNIWVGSAGGLSRFRNGRWTNWTTAQGLPDGGLYGLVPEGKNGLWAMSRAGLLYIPFEELNQVAVQRRINFNLAGESEGIHLYPERRTVSPRITRGPDGTLWIATMDGLATVYPGRRSVGTAPKALIERMYADGKRVSLAGRETAVVPGRQVQFEYTAIELTSSENLRFRYMLEGADKGWTDAGATRRVVYESLPPNRYRFRVAARSGLGPWEESGAAIAFRVPAGFYQTWWFFCACALTLGAGIFGLFRMRTLQLRYGLEMMYQERLRVTRELHDSLIQGFTGVVYQLDAALRSFDTSTGRTRDALRHALQQADQSLLDARHTITRLRLPALEKHSLPEAIRITAKELTEGGSISLSLDIEKSAAFLPYEIQSDLYMIARELLANAVNHSGASRIQLSLSCEERRFRMRVEDDGCGFDSAANPSEGHLGLTGCRERAKRIHALLKITSAPGKGTVADLHGTAVRRAADLNEGAAAIR